MAVNKVEYYGETLMDTSAVTVTPETLATGATALNAAGELITGNMEGGGGGGDLLNEDGVIKQEHLPAGYPYPVKGSADLVEGLEFVYDESQQGYVITTPVPIPAAGQTYTVVWNGVDYSCTAIEVSPVDGITFTMMGDVGAMDGQPTGEYPFLIGWYSEDFAASQGVYFVAQPLDGSTTLSLQVIGEVVTIDRIDPKYLPEGYPYVEVGEPLVDEQTVTLSDGLAEVTFVKMPLPGMLAEITIYSAGVTITTPPIEATIENAVFMFELPNNSGSLEYSLNDATGYLSMPNAPDGAVLTISAKVSDNVQTMNPEFLPKEVVKAPATLAENDLLIYNGTGWGTVQKSELGGNDEPELPAVTDADNGKFLRVVNGVWAASELTNVAQEGA